MPYKCISPYGAWPINFLSSLWYFYLPSSVFFSVFFVTFSGIFHHSVPVVTCTVYRRMNQSAWTRTQKSRLPRRWRGTSQCDVTLSALLTRRTRRRLCRPTRHITSPSTTTISPLQPASSCIRPCLHPVWPRRTVYRTCSCHKICQFTRRLRTRLRRLTVCRPPSPTHTYYDRHRLLVHV